MHREFFRYSVAGGLAFLIDASVLYLLTEFGGLHYLISACGSFVLGLVTVYVLNVAWVFERRSVPNRGAEFSIFVGINLVSLGLNELLLWLLTEKAGLHYLASKSVATGFIWFGNFFMRKMILFR